ncbi:MAG: NADPH-dependent F420 reductase [Vicinamibacterales bacterium]
MSGSISHIRRQFLIVAAGIAAAMVCLPSVRAQVAQTPQPHKIGIIGSGAQGGNIGLLWAQAGHEVLFSSRHPEELKELVAKAGPKAKAGLPQDAAAFGDVVLIAVPYGALPQVGRDYAAQMKGKVVIELGNPREDRDGAMANDAMARGTGVASAEYLPGVRLVRALNALSATQVQRDAHRSGELLGVPVAGDDAQAVQVAVQLVKDAGFDPVVVGGLARAREFDRNTPVYVKGMTAKQIREALKLPPQ